MEVKVTDKQNRLEVCRKIRTLASVTCLYSLQHVFKLSHKVSEEFFANFWNKELERSFLKGYVDSWYDPPPGGMAVLFAPENDLTRFNYESLRPNLYWPKMKSYFQKGGLGYLFSSAYTITQDIPIIGDFGFSYYLGKNVKIKDHYRKSYELCEEIREKIKTGMTFSEIYKLSEDAIKQKGLFNHIVAFTDKTGTDYGHTIPFIENNPIPEEQAKIESGDPQKINSVISHARRFISSQEDYCISDNCAFTFEPRLTNDDKSLPIFSFHQIVRFIDGKKVHTEDFRGLINYLQMNWLTD